jgi:hypothetical protein
MKAILTITFLLVSLSLLVAGAAADTIQVQNVQVNTIGGIIPVNIVLDTTPAGIAGYDITISLSNSSVATITDVSFPSWSLLNESTTLPASSVRVRTVDLYEKVNASDTDVPFGTITLEGKAVGSTDVVVTIKNITSDDGKSFTPAVQSGMFTVESSARSQPIIANHTFTYLSQVPLTAITASKQNLHIAYWHTSHGSQITDGMTGLTTFPDAPYGGSTYKYNAGGTDGALDLNDSYSTDLGNSGWPGITRNYLNAHPNTNVIMWSWCGQADNTEEYVNTYLNTMNQLETEYPAVTFVYMTGHLVGTGEAGNLNQRNEQIRNYAKANNKVLFDFADIESYNPDGVYYGNKYANDACNYDYNNNGVTEQDANSLPINGDHNWALDWQTSHTQGTDWYSCGAAHSQPLNANQKAYAAWWLWARLAGWDGNSGTITVSKFGVFRDGQWYIDYNGNGMWDATDASHITWFGVPGDAHPVVGDWNGDRKDDFGVFRDGQWYVDYNGNGVWDAPDIMKITWFGVPGDQYPVVGTW